MKLPKYLICLKGKIARVSLILCLGFCLNFHSFSNPLVPPPMIAEIYFGPGGWSIELNFSEYYGANNLDNIRMTGLYDTAHTMELIDSILVEDLKTNATIPYQNSRSGIFFEISLRAYGQSAYRVYFRQDVNEGHFKYILNSTASWGRSLEFANYELQMPSSFILDSLNYPPDTSFIHNNIYYYQWKKTDFMPDRDFEVFYFDSSGTWR